MATPLNRHRFAEEVMPITRSEPEPDEKAKPLDCAKAWAEVEKSADDVINSTQDPILRNKRINAAYANLYMKDPTLHWAGVAAFASKQVGCGLQSAKRVLDVGDMETEDAKHPMPSPDGMPVPRGMDLLTAYKYDKAKAVYNALTVGNRNVFKDIYPVHLFYEKHGIEGLRQCGKARNPPVSARVMQGFEDTAAGHSDKGAVNILYHEQHDILEAPNIFGSKEVQDIMGQNQAASEWWLGIGRLGGAERTTTAFSPDCTGGPTVTFNNENPAMFDQRWPFAQSVAGKFESLIANPQSHSQVLSDLRAIAGQGR